MSTYFEQNQKSLQTSHRKGSKIKKIKKKKKKKNGNQINEKTYSDKHYQLVNLVYDISLL